MSLDLKWHGPFGFLPDVSIACVFTHDIGKHPGLYLWTVPIGEEYLINYVGETERDFAERLEEEARYMLSGQDSFADSELLRQGIRKRISTPTITDFLGRYDYYSKRLYESLATCRLFLAPMNADRQLRQRVESALISHLRKTSERCRQFLANKKCLSPQSPPLEVNMSAPVALVGLGSTLLA